jgi:DNA-binding transcriptional regulator YiaG
MVMHYRGAAYCPGSGQFRTACGRVEPYNASTTDRSQVTCPECLPAPAYRFTEAVANAWASGQGRPWARPDPDTLPRPKPVSAPDIVALRRRLRLSQWQFGALLGVSRAQVQRLEGGQVAVGTLEAWALEAVALRNGLAISSGEG